MAVNNCSLKEPMLIELMEELPSNTGLLVMLVLTSVVTLTLLLLFIESTVFVATKIAHRDRSISLIWMLGIFPIFAVTSQMGLFIPRAVLMCNLTASIYYAISLYQFLQLIIYYYGGHDAIERKIAEHRILRTYQLNENSFAWLEICIYQMAFVRPFVLFIEDILWLNGTYNTSSLTFDDAYLYLNFITLISSLVAIIALLILYLASRHYLNAFFIDIKFVIIGVALFCSNIQILLLDVLTFTEVIPCSEPFNWESRANSWQCVCLIIESALLFPVALRYFRTTRGNMVGVLQIPRIAISKSPLIETDVDFADGHGNHNGNLKNPLLQRVRAETDGSLPRTRSSSSIYNSYLAV